MIKVGLTGGIGSGKTTVANFFSELGMPVYNADIEAKRIMNSSTLVKKKLIAAFGEEAYINGKLNSSFLASIVFNDKSKLEIINSIIHPEVGKDFLSWVKKQEAPYVIEESAILFENDLIGHFDYIITVTAPVEVRINRIIKRDQSSKDEILLRMSSQWDDKKKIELSDYIIHNIELNDTKKQVHKLHKKLLKKSNK
ncbi:MAG: dephospho-CoA kinase [Flavobacteriaceae bacterium]|nr:dephospho-CoA kinase [Flavobacteriaceae bacterium]